MSVAVALRLYRIFEHALFTNLIIRHGCKVIMQATNDDLKRVWVMYAFASIIALMFWKTEVFQTSK